MSFATSFIFVCLVNIAYTTLSPSESQLICKYDGIQGFPVPCSDATNACLYPGIACIAQNGNTWNETITGLDLLLTFTPGTLNVIPRELGNLRTLQRFVFSSLSRVSATTLPTELGLCTQLTSLSIGLVDLSGTIPTQLFNARQLTKLSLGLTALSGTLPSEIVTLTQLTYLVISHSSIGGTLPASLSALTKLRMFDLRDCQFDGVLPTASAWSQLEYYLVSGNQFTGDVPLLSSSILSVVDISHNMLDGTLPPLINPSSVGLFYSANANRLVGTIPGLFFDASLVTLDLSYNFLSGTLPATVIYATKLEQLTLGHNTLSGSLASSWGGATFNNLFRLGLDHNQFSGVIPPFMMGGRGRQSVTYEPHIYMDFNDNAFSGAVPAFPSPFSASVSLDLSNNALTLSALSFGNTGNLSWINMANNPLITIPANLFGNQLRFRSLVTLDLSHCQLTGSLPSFFGAQYLKLNNNYFTGVVPQDFIYQSDQTRLPVFADVRLNRLETDATRDTTIGSISSYLTGDVVLSSFPQDADECLLGTHACESLCIDGWAPVPGYTCACPSGYALDPVEKRNCTAVCGDALLRYPEEECDYEYSLVGCYRNCTTKPGYRCDATGCVAICGDGLVMAPEECDNTHVGCGADCKAVLGYTCSLTDNTCQSCAQRWEPFVYAPNLKLFPHLRAVIGDDLTDFDFTSCLTCDDGLALQTRAVLATSQCVNMSTQRTLACSFACTNLSVFDSASESVYTLQQELLKNDFIQQVFRLVFNLDVVLNSSLLTSSNRRRATTTTTTTALLHFTVSPCLSDKSAVMNVIRALTLDIVPNLPSFVLSETPCGVTVQSTDLPLSDIILLVVIAVSVASFCLLVSVCGGLAYYYYSSVLHTLPADISWSFLDKVRRPWAWQYTGNAKSGYYSRLYNNDSEDYRRVESLLSTHFKKGGLALLGITAIYNPSLTQSFVNLWKVMITRKVENPEMFFARTYTKDKEKMAVMNYYDKDLIQFTPYNQELAVPLIPMLHGTDHLVAEQIAMTGFAALSSLDEGYFGKGIYFTSSLLYILPYASSKRRPAVLISYINPGNPWPTTEEHDGPRSLKGMALKSGYNSHIVRTNKRGTIYHDQDDVLCDEMVVNQESQILPAFIIELSVDSCVRIYDKWSREPCSSSSTTTVEMDSEQYPYLVYDI